MNLKLLCAWLLNLALVALPLWAHLTGNKYGLNIFTALSVIAFLGGLSCFNDDTRNQRAVGYHERNLPGWADWIIYTTIILTCAAYGKWWHFIAWLLAAAADARVREAANKLESKARLQNN